MELIFFQHFHKSAGTTIVNLLKNKYKLHKGNINGNPYTVISNKRTIIKFWEFNKKEFREWINHIIGKGTQFIVCEWGFLRRENRIRWDNITFITCIRDPYNRMISNYNFDGGDHKFGHIKKYYNNPNRYWKKFKNEPFPITTNMSNYYVRQLSGCGNQHNEEITEEHLKEAKRVLELFSIIIILENPRSFSLLGKIGINDPPKHLKRRDTKDIRSVTNEFKNKFMEENRYDYELYEYAKKISSNMIIELKNKKNKKNKKVKKNKPLDRRNMTRKKMELMRKAWRMKKKKNFS